MKTHDKAGKRRRMDTNAIPLWSWELCETQSSVVETTLFDDSARSQFAEHVSMPTQDILEPIECTPRPAPLSQAEVPSQILGSITCASQVTLSQAEVPSLIGQVATRVLFCTLVVAVTLVILLAPVTAQQAAAVPEIPLTDVVDVDEVSPPTVLGDQASPAEPEPEVQPGVLIVRVKPWGKVWVDGQRVGTTPIGRLPLSPGKHVVTAGNPRLRLRRTRHINIRSGKPTKVFVDFTARRPVRHKKKGRRHPTQK